MVLLPKYELLFNDLMTADLGSYFKSRSFKIYMIKKGYYDEWKAEMKRIDSERTVIDLASDFELTNSKDTFKSLLNSSNIHKSDQTIATDIIVEFILSKGAHTNYDNILESLELANFDGLNIIRVKNIIKSNYNNQKQSQIHDIVAQKVYDIMENKIDKKEVFIVHGHNDTLKLDVARTLEKLKLQPIILHEQSNNGKTIIEKFEKFSDVAFAIILLTADDLGNSKNTENLNKRARQNVIFELGYFIGKLGRENVMALKEDGVETPNDISGVLYTPYDLYGNWKTELAKELKSAGFKVDMNDLF